MTTRQIATYYNSQTNSDKAHSFTNPNSRFGVFFCCCLLKILSWRHHLSGRPTIPVLLTGKSIYHHS